MYQLGEPSNTEVSSICIKGGNPIPLRYLIWNYGGHEIITQL
jgi:hypothetical protein